MHLPFSHIPQAQVLRYLGWHGGSLPPEMEVLLAQCIQEMSAVCQPRYVWRRLALTRTDAGLFAGGLQLPGTQLPALLRGCESCILFALTLGDAPEALIRKAAAIRPTRALILDACASAACEQSCDDLQALLEKQFQQEQLFSTSRYSPGYGDLPLSLQSKLLELLNASRQIGLTLTDTSLMVPRKSVTAIFGLSGAVHPRRESGCDRCNLNQTCSFRKAGIPCTSESDS